MGQTHRVKEHLAQLLGAVGVEGGAAGLHLDACQHLFQLPAQPCAELINAVPIDQHADAGHICQHLCKRELDLVVQSVLAAGGDLCLHLGEQVGKPPGIRVIGAGKGGCGTVARFQISDLILGGGRIQQVGGQLAVPHDAAAPAARCHRLGVQRRRVENIQRDGGLVQQAEQLCVLQRVDGGLLHGVPALRCELNVFGTLFAHHSRACCDEIVPGGGKGEHAQLCFRQFHGGFLFRCFGGDAVQPEAGDQGMDLQLLQKAHSGRFVALTDDIRAFGGVDGRIGADGAQRVAQLGQLAALDQVLALFGLDELIVDVLVNAFQRAKGLHKGQSGLFANALYAGDVVRGVAHQALDLDELAGGHAVFLLHGIHVHGDGLAAPHHGGS